MDRIGAYLLARECQIEPSAGTDAVFHGRGMEPFLRDGDRLSLDPVEWSDVRTGDVVACRLDDRMPTLRVIHKRGPRLDLRADAHPDVSFSAWQDDLVGRVSTRRRAGRTLRRRDARWMTQTGRVLAQYGLAALRRRTRRVTTRAARSIARRLKPSELASLSPAVLHLNVSAACNLGCRMCPYLSVHDDRNYERLMRESTFREMLEPIRRARHVGIAGSGEPLMNKALAAFVRTAREVNPDLEVDLTTNGTLISESVATALIKAGLNRLTVSIDGARQETVARIRIGINLEEVLENVRRVQRLKGELGSAFPILRINYMVGFGNYDELPELVAIAKSCGVREIYLLEVLDGTEASVRDNLCHSAGRDEGAQLKRAIRLAEASGIQMMMPYADAQRCLQPETPHVSEDGSVSPCCFVDYNGRSLFVDGQKVDMPQLVFGNVHQTSFKAIWNQPEFVEFRDRARRGDFTDFCSNCVRARVPTSDVLRRYVG